MDGEEHWAQLVSITDIESSPVLVASNTFVLGRNEDCDLSFGGNKLVSGKHCYIEKSDDGETWLYDTSTNGTLLNLKTKISKGKRHKLQHGDEIYVVYKKNESDLNIGYVFQERALLEKEFESDSTQDYSYEADKTLSDDAVNCLDGSKSDHSKLDDDEDEEEKPSLKRKADNKELNLTEKKQKTDTPQAAAKHEAHGSVKVTNAAEASTSKQQSEPDDMLITLSCIICQELLHDCVSLQPCLHTFCSGCYSEWMEKSDLCPSCRMKVDRINKNHLVNNMVEAFLKTHPGLKRSESDVKELEAKNKITRDMLYPVMKPTGIEVSSEGSGISDDDEEEDEDEVVNNPQPYQGLHWQPAPFINPTPLIPATPQCKQCPNFQAPTGITPPRPPADPNDDDAKVFPAAPPYTCRNNGSHVLCLCCFQPMPDRRREYTDGGPVPTQQCILCLRSFCHAYWGCDATHCNGCIGKLKDMNFGINSLNSIILDNAYESRVFKDYLASKKISVRALLAECLARMVTGEWKCANQANLTYGINSPVCYGCAFKMFKELALCYRLEISDADLPTEVTRRPDCYWGKNCRTQRNKPEHAQKFNHICDQTRTA